MTRLIDFDDIEPRPDPRDVPTATWLTTGGDAGSDTWGDFTCLISSKSQSIGIENQSRSCLAMNHGTWEDAYIAHGLCGLFWERGLGIYYPHTVKRFGATSFRAGHFMHTLVNCKCILWCFKSQVITCKMVLTPHTLSWRFIWEISQVINLKLQAGNEKCNWQFGVYETETT